MSLSRRKFIGGAAGAACVLGGFGIGRWSAPGPAAEGEAGGGDGSTTDNARRRDAQPGAMFGVRTKEKVVAMSFDDGPDARYTQHVLDLLASHRSHATFFEIGANALGLPKLTLATLAAGHSIGNHTHDHPDLEQFNPSQVDVEIERGADAIAKAGAPRPEFFRPPKGLTDEVVGVLADAEKYRTVFWGSCVEAFVLHQDVAAGVEAMLNRIQPGDIVLAHDGGHVIGFPDRPTLSRERTMKALPMLFDGLAQRGFKVVDVPRLLQVGPIR